MLTADQIAPKLFCFDRIINSLLNTGRFGTQVQPNWASAEVTIKLMEEVGELAEAVLVETGKMSHKTLDMDDPVFEEGADAILVVIDLLSKMYGATMTNDEIMSKLAFYLNKKQQKWEGIIKDEADRIRFGSRQGDLFADTPKDYNVHILGQTIRVDSEDAAWAVIENAPFGAVYTVSDREGNVRPEFIPL